LLPKVYEAGKGMAKRVKKFDQTKGAKAISRETIGTVPASRPIEERPNKKKPKHPKRDQETDLQ
jgi:hypothetical protein